MKSFLLINRSVLVAFLMVFFMCPCLAGTVQTYYIVSPNGYAIYNQMGNEDMTYHRLAALDKKNSYLKYVIARDGEDAQIYCPVHGKAFDTDEAICSVLHDFELPSVRADKTYVYLDAVQQGLGCAVCGDIPLKQYMIPVGEPVRLRVRLYGCKLDL